MNPALIFEIISLAAGVLKSRTSDSVDDKVDEATALARIVAAARQAYLDNTGKPLDEASIKHQERLP